MTILDKIKRHFKTRGEGWVRDKLFKYIGISGEEYAWIGALQAQVAALWAWCVAFYAAIMAWFATVWAIFVAWITPLVTWLQWKMFFIETWIEMYIIPLVLWLQAATIWIQAAVLLIQGKIEAIINLIYTDIFGWLEDLRKGIGQVISVIKDVVSIFNRDLSDRIQVTEDKFFKLLDKYTRDIRDWAISQLHTYTDPIVSKINEITTEINKWATLATSTFDKLTTLIGATFEKPSVLKRDVLSSTSMHWGVDLWNDLFSGVVPPARKYPTDEMEQLKLDPFIESHIKAIFDMEAGDWADVSTRIDEEIAELYYGKVIPDKTKLNVPKLAPGQIG